MIVTEGLKRFKTTKNIGLKALIDVSTNGKAITTSTIGYTIAPRINASGRLGCASTSVELFLTEDEEEAAKLADSLCHENTLRQQTEQRRWNILNSILKLRMMIFWLFLMRTGTMVLSV